MKKAPKSSAKGGARNSVTTTKGSKPSKAAAVARKPTASAPKGKPKLPPDRGRPKATPPPASDPNSQRTQFDQAIERFHSRRFADAKALFERAASGLNLEIAHAARLHVRMCEQRLASSQPVPSSPDALYDVAITLINRRELAMAEDKLHQALGLQESGSHIHYAMALCRGLQGDEDGAAKHLRRAIELDPRNRAAARNDPDFADLLRSAAIRELVFPERKLSV